MVQYPHTITVTSSTAATLDGQGNWTPGTTSSAIYKCRAESNTNNGFISGADGQRIDFSWVIYMPKGGPEIALGSQVTVTNNSVVLLNDTVKRFSRGQLNTRVWL